MIGGKLGQAWRYYIWLLVLFRLMLPIAAPVNLFETFLSKGEVMLGGTKDTNTDVIPDIPIGAVAEPNPMPKTVHTKEMPVGFPTLPMVVFIVWLLTAFVLFGRKVLRYAAFLRFVWQNGLELEEYSLLEAYASACDSLGMHSIPRVFVLPSASTPMSAGVLQPFLVLPENLDSERAYYMFLHELMHCKRYDALYKWVVELNVCLHWFNPAIDLVRREIARMRASL